MNSDTKVFKGWDAALISHLENYPDVQLVGQLGGILNEDGMGVGYGYGYDIDFVMGWCMCMPRSTYEVFGLFNKQLTFAYCEDADLSLRIKEAGSKIYALHSPLVYHYGNVTIKEVAKEGDVDVSKTFELNHQYMKVKWKDYL